MEFVFSPQQAVVPVEGSGELFPVHRIYCVGRNYAEHAIEMGDSGREAPFFFMKPADAVLPVAQGSVGEMAYPTMTKDLHHEIELVVALASGGKNISAAEAVKHIYGYAVGLDMTRRDLQAEAKKLGRPWCTSKGFDQSAPISAIRPISVTGPIERGPIQLNVNGQLRQQGDINQLIWSIAETIEQLSNFYELHAGDLIFTGTPAGVAAVVKGDLLEGSVEGVGDLRLRLV
ncbi:fumarylacetoacetate hydrolase family protein [Glaciimonas sp. Gout2]|uniref:fumarylacetoacetate hydrolase family protein n=1 Tax=unclassified Glaciimonas TaxID=2644401 RepID=UPI002B22BCB1|nr:MULTISPECIES: fumarylacetoacetate hydrolase family protein [unclassified Glaciimonas]MEB0012671.1 fumarylacetoacetate hydrolase family protein [Glaciimonas sp. Cout2]MEB0082988.1 fumarylacetoacetate hydrolase family protein [Glaciimonas sp. Gout2]